MSLLLYNIALRIYSLLILLAWPFNTKARLWVNGRRNYFPKLQRIMYKNAAPVIWFHCASLGEFEQSRPLIEEIKRRYPAYNIFLTFFSPSGYEVRKNYSYADYVFYLPLDTPFNARKFVRIINPKIAFIAKYEFWYHYINELKKKNIPVISFSTIFRKKQIFFKSYGSLFRGTLHKITRIFVQNEKSIELLKKYNIHNTEIAGDTRFDRVYEVFKNKKEFPLIQKFKGDKKIFIVGSNWPQDLEILFDTINQLPDNLKVIIAPHEIKEKEISDIEQRIKKKSIRYSQVNEKNASVSDVLIIDNVGMLGSLYQYGDLAYVGGAFGKGLHNILEPATFGMPVFFGPKYNKFKEAKDLIKLKAAFSVQNRAEFESKFSEILNDGSRIAEINKTCLGYVQKNIGATEKIINYCKQYLN
ncbi:MAG: 3-deoxy-D-manno-octulosonic acid transferase [Cytophagaceae bacterium]|nr:3-deoxy-D-manno-octulosonic acid transferase [Cytophagaceae bacterium]